MSKKHILLIPIISIFISVLKPYLLSGSIDRSMKLWDIQNGACIRVFNNIGPINSIRTSQTHLDLISSSLNYPILLDHGKNMTWNYLSKDMGITTSALSKDGSFAVLGTKNGNVKVIDIETKSSNVIKINNNKFKLGYLFQNIKSNSNKLAFFTNKIKITTTFFLALIHYISINLKFKDAMIVIRNNFGIFSKLSSSIINTKMKFQEYINTLILIAKLKIIVKAIEISTDNNLVFIAIYKSVYIMNRENGKLINKFESRSPITVMKLYQNDNNQDSSKTELIYLGCANGNIYSYTVRGELLSEFTIGKVSPITSMYIYQTLLLAGNDLGYSYLYNINYDSFIYQIGPLSEFSDSAVTSVAIESRETNLFVGYRNGVIAIYNTLSGKIVKFLNGNGKTVTSMNIIKLDEENDEDHNENYQCENEDKHN